MALREYRRKISSAQNFYVTYNGLSPEDNLPISFTFGKDEFVRFRREIRKGTGEFVNIVEPGKLAPTQRLPLEERYSARWFDISDIFTNLDINDDNSLNIDEFYDLRTWDEYKNYLSSSLTKVIKRPKHMKYSEFHRIGVDRTK